MKDDTRRALNALNQRFYDARGSAFDASRDHPWPGWSRALASLEHAALQRVARDAGDAHTDAANPAPRSAKPARLVLDVGCGNGRFGAWLMHRDAVVTHYIGVDASTPLLERARAAFRSARSGFDVELQNHDFLDGQGPEALPAGPFDLIVVFGVLHHVPGDDLRRRLVAALAERLAPGGGLVLTAWQFSGRTRFERSLLSQDVVRARSADWGFDADDLEANDHFLGFGGDAEVPRYCHALDEVELEALTRNTGLTLVDAFTDDGKSGDLNAYRVLTKPFR